MARDVRIAIVTAAGYTDASRYHGRLAGLLSAVATSPLLNTAQRLKLCVMGGESNYLFRFAPEAACLLEHVPESCWRLDEMRMWSEGDIEELVNVAETAFRECVEVLEMDRYDTTEAASSRHRAHGRRQKISQRAVGGNGPRPPAGPGASHDALVNSSKWKTNN